MSLIGEQLLAAQTVKSNDLTSYVWKGARSKNHEQSEVKLIDMSEDDLNKCYKHCQAMLYNTDKNNPGRYTLLNIIRDQRIRCNAELFLRHLENAYKPTPNRRAIQRYMYLDSVNSFLRENKEAFPEDRSEIDITEITNDVPEEFCGIPVSYVVDGCLRRLGTFNKKHMTLTFITNKLGLWFSQEEMNEFTNESKQTGKSRIDLVKDRCGLKPTVSIQVNENKVLTFKEFRALIQLRSKSYSEMTTDQLVVLRNKGLFCLEEEVLRHAQQWEDRKEQILKVAKSKGYTINE